MELSVVTTMYHSQEYLHEFYNKVKAAVLKLNISYEVIFVDDGSPDHSLSVALSLQQLDANVKVIELSRNFGHQKAIMTGLVHAEGEYVFLIDCDLEESPELLIEFWWQMKGKPVDVVYGVQSNRKGKWFERLSGHFFYRLMDWISPVKYPANTLTARLMTRNYVRTIVTYTEKELDLWGIFAIVGFNQVPFPTTKGSKGKSTFTTWKKIRRALEVITSFSHRPLYLTFFLGIGCFLVAFVNIIVIVYKKLVLHVDVEGWASILASIWFVGGMILLVLGIFGIYLSKIFLEIKNRPLTVVRNVYKK